MSLRLLLDEDTQAKYLINLLRVAGHDVFTVQEANVTSRADAEERNTKKLTDSTSPKQLLSPLPPLGRPLVAC